jgi:hypothetical protein
LKSEFFLVEPPFFGVYGLITGFSGDFVCRSIFFFVHCNFFRIPGTKRDQFQIRTKYRTQNLFFLDGGTADDRKDAKNNFSLISQFLQFLPLRYLRAQGAPGSSEPMTTVKKM